MYAYKHSHVQKSRQSADGRGRGRGTEGTTTSLESLCTWPISLCTASTVLWSETALSSGLQSLRKRDTAKQWARKFSGSHCSPLFPQFLKPNLLSSNQNPRGGFKREQANSERPDGTGTVQALTSPSTTCPGSSSLIGQGSGLGKSRGQLECSMYG